MRTILVGIDDTDNLTSPGTGRLARDLCAELTKKGMKSLGVTRHQFLVDDGIAYTSHNSGACIALATENGKAIADFVCDFVAGTSAAGSDPGVCVEFADAVSTEIMGFGQVAQREILTIEQAFERAKSNATKLRGLGGDCLGVIGALAAVGLRSQGADGRFIDLPGLRDLPRKVNLAQLEAIGIEVVHKNESAQAHHDATYDTLDWARPCLINGKPVLVVEWSEQENAWTPVDRKKS